MMKFFRKNETNSSKKNPTYKSGSGQGLENTGQGQKKDTHTGRRRVKTDLLVHDLKVPLAVIEAGIVSLLKRVDKYG
ncbi:MAG: hypothetical protein JSV50_09175, partial [Desulfobacteraceae bacterium]